MPLRKKSPNMVLLPTAFVPRDFYSDGICRTDSFIRETLVRGHIGNNETQKVINACFHARYPLHLTCTCNDSQVCRVKCCLANFWAALGLCGTPGERLWIALFLWTNLAWASLNSGIQFVILLLKASLRYMLVSGGWGLFPQSPLCMYTRAGR